MPVYEYRCMKCKREVELQQSINDETVPLCCEDSCGGIAMQRVISSTSFVLVGGGWGRDGYSK